MESINYHKEIRHHYLIDTIRSMNLYRLEKGTPIQTGDLILIWHKRYWLSHIIIHSMIAIENDIWYGANNAYFFLVLIQN